LKAQIESSPKPVYVVGFSQGSVVAGELSWHPNVARTYLFADPHRPPYQNVGNGHMRGPGLAGTKHRSGIVHQLAIPDDVITSASPDSLLRSLADFTAMMGPDVVKWAMHSFETIKRNQHQKISWRHPQESLKVLRLAHEARMDLEGYLGGRHVQYPHLKIPGLHVTYTEWVVRSLNFLGAEEMRV